MDKISCTCPSLPSYVARLQVFGIYYEWMKVFLHSKWYLITIAISSVSINNYKLSADSDLAPPALSSLQHRPTWSSPSTAQLKQAAVAQTIPTYDITIHSNAWLKKTLWFITYSLVMNQTYDSHDLPDNNWSNMFVQNAISTKIWNLIWAIIPTRKNIN